LQLTQIKVKGFRSFCNEVTIDELKPVNVFVGKNNAGKTNVLEILRLIASMVLTRNPHRAAAADIISKAGNECTIDLLFSFSESERTGLIERMAQASGRRSAEFLSTAFLRTAHYAVTISTQRGIEKEFLWISNLAKGDLLLLSSRRPKNSFLERKFTSLLPEVQKTKTGDNIVEAFQNSSQENGTLWGALERYDQGNDYVTPMVRDFSQN
jgi:predicted ATP-dependent endonuclease of OLD family